MSKDKWLCDSCGDPILNRAYYTMEAPSFIDMRFCGKCAKKWFKKVKAMIKESS